MAGDSARPTARRPGARHGALLGVLALALLAGGFAAWRVLEPHGAGAAASVDALDAGARRPHYVFVNRTARHEYDLALKMSLKIAEDKSGIENAMVLLDALPAGRSIDALAAELLTRWKVGARDHGRGVLYLYSARENQLKIEVSYDLEPEITDLYCRRMQEAAKTYMLSEMPQDFLSELVITTNLRGMATKGEADLPAAPSWYVGGFLSGGGGALVQGYAHTVAELQQAIARLPAHAEELLQPSDSPDTTVLRYLASLQAGIGDPRLPLLTEGSRLFRGIVPRNVAQQRRIYEYFQAALPYRLLVQGDFAIAAPQPGHSNLPIVLRRGSDGLWYVDEAKSWTWFHRYEDSTDFFVKYGDNPFLPELRRLGWPRMDRAIYENYVTTPLPPPYPYDLGREIARLEAQIGARPADAAAHAALGDLYLFEVAWLGRALEQYEAAARLAPAQLAYHWRLADLYLNLSRADGFLAELRFLAEHLPEDRALRQSSDAYARGYAQVQDD